MQDIYLVQGEYYTLKFNFNKEAPNWLKETMQKEFMMLRPYACKALNPKYDKWNEEFGDTNVSDDDELADYGGSEYCKFICKKSRKVLEKVNKKHPMTFTKIDVDEVGDLVGVNTKTGTVMHMTLHPLKTGT